LIQLIITILSYLIKNIKQIKRVENETINIIYFIPSKKWEIWFLKYKNRFTFRQSRSIMLTVVKNYSQSAHKNLSTDELPQ